MSDQLLPLPDLLCPTLDYLGFTDLLALRAVCANIRDFIHSNKLLTSAVTNNPGRLLTMLHKLCRPDWSQSRRAHTPEVLRVHEIASRLERWGRELTTGLTLEIAKRNNLYSLYLAVQNDKLDVARWIWSLGFDANDAIRDINSPHTMRGYDLLRVACSFGSILMIRWVAGLAKFSRLSRENAHIGACEENNVAGALWSLANDSEAPYAGFEIACDNAAIDVAMLYYPFITLEIARESEYLTCACRSGSLKLVEHVWALGMSVEDIRDSNVFQFACLYGHIIIMQFLWEQGLDIDDIRRFEISDHSLVAALCGADHFYDEKVQVESVRWLWAHGLTPADIEAEDGCGLSPIGYAARSSPGLFEWLSKARDTYWAHLEQAIEELV